MHFRAMAEGRRSFYTCPIKALVSEKFFALCRDFGAENVGMMTGDASVNRDAPILCCTAEILANIALRDGPHADVDVVIMDEFHYYADRDRGVAWQVPLLTLPQATFLLMSATLGPTQFFEDELTRLTGKETVLIKSSDRPVPLDFDYRETPLHETVAQLVQTGRAPIYVVNFTQRAAAEAAQDLLSVDFISKERKRTIAEALDPAKGVRFDSPYGKEVQKLLRHGVGIHHAGLLPKYRLLVEKLAQRGLLEIISGTDTLGVGVNVPIRTVLFTRLCKFDGEKTAILSVRDFQQIAGRAGRKGFDTQGSVVAQAPEHVIENLRMEAKAGSDPAKKRKMVKKKPPERGYVHWDRSTFDRLTTSQPEPLVSRFQVTHGMMLEVLSRGCRPMKQLIFDSHETNPNKHRHAKTAIQLFHSLVTAGIVEFVKGEHDKTHLQVNAELQDDFSLHQTLSLYLVDTVEKLDKASPDYALDLLGLVEAIVENPDLILMKQVDRLKTIAMAEMKQAGIEFDERIAKLDLIDYPKPNAEAIYASFNAFSKKHPWVGTENIRPKAIAREMVEGYLSFADYIKEYELHRAEGLLLRYLTEVYKALVQTVPELARTPEVDDIIVYLRELVRGVDSSLLEEWERMRDPDYLLAAASAGQDVRDRPPLAQPARLDEAGYTRLLRNELFRFVRSLAARDWEAAAAQLDDPAWPQKTLEETMKPFFVEHPRLRTDREARGTQGTAIERPSSERWSIRQTMFDDEDANDWVIEATVMPPSTRLQLARIGT
jgi:superfamily II RNA helicase